MADAPLRGTKAMEPDMEDDTELQERIRARAYRLWEEDGRPDGREMDHWDKARILVAIEDDRTSLIPVAPTRPEEAFLQANLGEFPTAMTDEGDRQQTPSRQAEEPATTASRGSTTAKCNKI
jgi:Protein of unknown function (DUF2934)